MKGWENAKRLKTQFGAALVHGLYTLLFAWDEELGKSGDTTVTYLMLTLIHEWERRKAEGLPWPKVLYLQGDNGSDNKNKALFMFCELLVRLGIFEKVKFSFLPVGHTHEDVDACFGAGSHMLHRLNALTFAELLKLWKRGWPSTKSFEYLSVSYCSLCHCRTVHSVAYGPLSFVGEGELHQVAGPVP
jgi:hypothetical protein